MVVHQDQSVLRGVPEFFENELYECLSARTECLATFRELGPPDLCHVVKTNPKAITKEEEPNATLPKNQHWKLKSGTYCCFNAFSRVDVRVEVKIPGGVEGYIVDLKGEKHQVTNPAIWQETFVSAVLRSILDENDEADGNDGKPILGLRKLDPLTIPPSEKKFLEACKGEFWKGWQLGTEPHVQVATFFSNHLTNGIYKYFADSGRFNDAARFFSDLAKRDPEVAALVARAHIENDDEIKAVHVLHEALRRNPYSYGLILVQIDFLIRKKRFTTALKLAKIAVTHAPSEYVTWAKLTEVYVCIGDFESALLSLNSCPMFTYTEKDAHRMPPPARTHLPLKTEVPVKSEEESKKPAPPPISGTIFDDNDPKENEVHPELLRLPSLTLKGTFMRAYLLLIKMVNSVGWDELLRYRSQVFVMEEEYRVHRAMMEEKLKAQLHQQMDDEIKLTRDEDEEEQEDLAYAPPPRSPPNDSSSDKSSANDDDEMEEDGDLGQMEAKVDAKPHVTDGSPARSFKGLSIDDVMKRVSVHPSDDSTRAKSVSPDPQLVDKKPPNPRLDKHAVSFTFKTKRLCEKWLDNLFMVLYNDLRLYTALKQEITQFKTMNNGHPNALLYRKTGAEWEIYGDLALRLDHIEDAKEAYKCCLEQKFSSKSLLKLLDLYSEEGNINNSLAAVVRLATVLDKAYVETTYPTPIARGLFRLIHRHGLAKVQNALYAMNIPQKQFRVISRYFEYAELFKIEGVLW